MSKNRLRALTVPVLFGIFLLGYLALGLATMANGHGWGDDWAQYVLHARNIASVHPYADTGYLFNVDIPNVGPPSYPPGLPLLLTPIFFVFGMDILAFKIVCFVCTLLALPVTFRLLSLSVDKSIALIAVLLFALHPYVWSIRHGIASEAPYLLFSMLALWWGARSDQRDDKSLSSTAAGVLLGFLLYSTVISRSIGITLLPAIMVYGWAQRKPLSWFVGFILSFSLFVWLQTLWLVKPTTYENELRVPTMGLILSNANNYWLSLADLVPMPFGFSRLSAAAVVVLAALGALNLTGQRKPIGQTSNSVRTLAARVPLILWYLAAYLLALLVAAIEPNSRYLLPILPIVIALAAEGAFSIAKRFRLTKRIMLYVAVGLAIYWAALYLRKSNDDQATCDACLEMFSYVRTNTTPDSVIVFAKPRAMALLGGRASWRPSAKYTTDEFTRKLEKVGASIAVVGTPGSNFAVEYPATAALAQRIQDPGAERLFRNSMFEVIRLGAPRVTR